MPVRLLVPSGPWDWPGPILNGPSNFPLIARLDASERHALQFFTSDVAGPLQHALPAPEWIQLALQLSLSEEPVLYAITAFTAMLKAQDRVLFDMSLRKFTCMDYRLSMQQYGRAISILRKYIGDAVKLSATIEPVLVTCLLFVSFEILHDDKVNARAHLQMGRGIIEEYLNRADACSRVLPSGLKVSSSQSIEQLISSFKRFQDGAVTILDPMSPFDRQSPIVGPVPFASLNEARSLLDSLIDPSDQLRADLIQLARRQLVTMNRSFADLDHVTKLCAAKCLSRSKVLWFNGQSTKRLDELLRGHSAWLEAFVEYKKAEKLKLSKQLLFLEIRHFCSHILLSICRTTDNTIANFNTLTFTHILDLIEQYLDLAAGSPAGVVENRMQQMYSLEMGVLPALAVIACSSKSLAVRQRAINLFCTCDIVEGCCGSELTGRIMAAIVGIAPESVGDPANGETETDGSREEPHGLERPEFLEMASTAHWEHIRVVYGRFSTEDHSELELFEFEGRGYPLRISLTTERTLPLGTCSGV